MNTGSKSQDLTNPGRTGGASILGRPERLTVPWVHYRPRAVTSVLLTAIFSLGLAQWVLATDAPITDATVAVESFDATAETMVLTISPVLNPEPATGAIVEV
jgi:hypothetical protein